MTRTLFNLARSAVVTGVLLLGPVGHAVVAGAAAPTPDPVKDCPKGLVCFTIKEQADIDRRLAEFDRMKGKRHILGWHTTCGLGVAGVVDEKFDLRAVPAGFCGIGFGF